MAARLEYRLRGAEEGERDQPLRQLCLCRDRLGPVGDRVKDDPLFPARVEGEVRGHESPEDDERSYRGGYRFASATHASRFSSEAPIGRDMLE